MKLQQATRYAIWSVIELASRPGESISAGDLASKYDISQHHLAKVLRTLTRARIVSSSRGPGGGFVFSGKANRLTIYDIISLFEGDWLSGVDTMSAENTPITYEVNRVLNEIHRITCATLRSVTVQTIIRNSERAKQLKAVLEKSAQPADAHGAGERVPLHVDHADELK
jgi:Rrf2 family transcriptional regulator, nitric oxide-sensitive transcriptional repressor